MVKNKNSQEIEIIMLENIPNELKILPKWVISQKNKIPLNPKTKQNASVTASNTWGTYHEAVESNYRNIGFVLTKDDPYTIIDLDAPVTPEQSSRHSKILKSFESYSEVSTSGTGVHIIVRGKIPRGARRDNVEIYSENRYMICTGKLINSYPINHRQKLLNILFSEVHPTEINSLVESDISQSDDDVVSMAMRAINSDKFLSLCNGIWKGKYPSQSEADFALLSIISFYTKSNSQVRRIFRYSELGRRKKAVLNDKYIDLALKKIRSKEQKPIDFSNFISTAYSPGLDNPSKHTTNHKVDYPFPNGLVGDIAQYIFSSSIRPVRAISLVGAIGLVAGVCARTYNISGTGLNQYLILLAGTGTGKEAISTGIDSLIASVSPFLPFADKFIGPSGFASGQALLRIFDKHQCFVSVVGEFGLLLQQILHKNASAPQIMLKRVLLDLYGKSGFSKILRPNVYSDTSKNTQSVRSPCLTIIGETTQDTFFDGLDSGQITDGLLPRFSIVEYQGKRPQKNPNAFHNPSQGLIDRLSDFITINQDATQNNSCCFVDIDTDAKILLSDFDHKADLHINTAPSISHAQLWNRAHLKALKLSALIAVGVNTANPIVDKSSAQWAIDFTDREISTVLHRFEVGDVGCGDQKQESDTRKAISSYLTMDSRSRLQYRVPKSMLNDNVIPYVFLRRKLKTLMSFKSDRRSAVLAISTLLDDMVKSDVLIKLSDQQVLDRYESKSPAYILGPSW